MVVSRTQIWDFGCACGSSGSGSNLGSYLAPDKVSSGDEDMVYQGQVIKASNTLEQGKHVSGITFLWSPRLHHELLGQEKFIDHV